MKHTILISFVFLLAACNSGDELSAVSKLGSQARIWAYMQFNIPEENEQIESYYYFAEVSEELFNQISANQINHGFISLNNVKYWGENDNIVDYADDEYSGNLVFRIENIERIERMNGELVFGNDTAQAQVKTDTLSPDQEQIKDKELENNIVSPKITN